MANDWKIHAVQGRVLIVTGQGINVTLFPALTEIARTYLREDDPVICYEQQVQNAVRATFGRPVIVLARPDEDQDQLAAWLNGPQND